MKEIDDKEEPEDMRQMDMMNDFVQVVIKGKRGRRKADGPDEFRNYRSAFGYPNQADLKVFLSAKDTKSDIDYGYIELLNIRLAEIVQHLNDAVHESIKTSDIEKFCDECIFQCYDILRNNGMLPKLNNQGRRPEQVYFSWMRGKIVSQFFTTAIAQVFGVDESKITNFGNYSLSDPDSFKRTPTAELQISVDGKFINMAIQSGYQGVNDIKEHKVKQANKQYADDSKKTIIMHVDLFNGQVAFVDVSQISDKDVNWITRQQMEGQRVFNINQSHFTWKLVEKPPFYKELKIFL